MYTVLTKHVATIEVERSKFIALLLPLTDLEQVKNELEIIKKDYPNARHYVYAAKVGVTAKSSDDGEPSGTAGRPLMNLLANHELDNVLLVVVRYFGGIKLGAGRLLRTYVESGQEVIAKSELYAPLVVNVYELETSYADFELIKRNLDYLNAELGGIDYNINVKFELLSFKQISEPLSSLTLGKVNGTVARQEVKYQKANIEVKR